MEQEFKDYTVFKPGSYWVYARTDMPGIMDSEVVLSHRVSINNDPEPADGPPPYEEFKDSFFSSFYGKFIAKGDGLTNDLHVKYQGWPDYETTYFTPVKDVILDDWGNMQLLDYFESFQVNGKDYKRVIEFAADPNVTPKVFSPIGHIWWAKNIGIIQKIDSTLIWKLIRYHVEQ